MAWRGLLFILCSMLALVSCSEIRQPALSVTSTTTELAPGKSAQLTVTRQFPGGGPIETVTNEVRYSVSTRDILDVSATGLVTPGPEQGEADVRISDLEDSATTTIRFKVVAAKIVSMTLDPPDPSLRLVPGDTKRLGVLAKMTDGTEQNVTTSVVWSSSYEAVATVGRTQGDIGNITAIRAGETTITATDTATNVQARLVVIVQGEPAQLAAINVSPNPASVAVGQPFPLTAIGVYTNGTTEDITKTSAWFSTDPSVATVDANGIVTGQAKGSVTITAAGPAELIKGSTSVTVE